MLGRGIPKRVYSVYKYICVVEDSTYMCHHRQQISVVVSSSFCVQVSVQMFQLYRDGLEDLLKEAKGKKKAADDPLKRSINSNGQLKITLAEHSPTGLVHVIIMIHCYTLESICI